MPYLSSTARMRKIPTRLPYSWLPQPPISGNCGWLPLHSPSGPPIGLTATGVPGGTSQSQCSRLTMTASATRALSGQRRTGRVTIGDHG